MNGNTTLSLYLIMVFGLFLFGLAVSTSLLIIVRKRLNMPDRANSITKNSKEYLGEAIRIYKICFLSSILITFLILIGQILSYALKIR